MADATTVVHLVFRQVRRVPPDTDGRDFWPASLSLDSDGVFPARSQRMYDHCIERPLVAGTVSEIHSTDFAVFYSEQGEYPRV